VADVDSTESNNFGRISVASDVIGAIRNVDPKSPLPSEIDTSGLERIYDHSEEVVVFPCTALKIVNSESSL
jgi:hypothetical protein